MNRLDKRPMNVDELPRRLPPLKLETLDEKAFYLKYPPERIMDLLDEKRSVDWPRLAWLTAGLTATAALLFLVLPAPHGNMTNQGYNQETIAPATSPEFGVAGKQRDKGLDRPGTVSVQPPAPSINVELLGNNGFSPVANGQILRNNDLLQISYDSTGHDYLFLFGLDSKGTITPYYPDEKGVSIPVQTGRRIPLPGAIQLDDYVGYERIFAIFTTRPISYLEVEVAARTSLLLMLARGKGVEDITSIPIAGTQATLLIEKR